MCEYIYIFSLKLSGSLNSYSGSGVVLLPTPIQTEALNYHLKYF